MLRHVPVIQISNIVKHSDIYYSMFFGTVTCFKEYQSKMTVQTWDPLGKFT